VKNTESVSEVKPHSQLAQLKAKLKGIGGRHRYGRFTREQIETLKLALVPHLLSICQRLFPYGVLSRTGEYWVIPALEITVNLETGDFFPWPFEPGRRIGDFISLYIDYSGLPFRQAAAALGAIAADIEKAPLPPFPADGKSNAREKRRIVHAALFATNGEIGALSSLAIRRRVLAHLAAHVERHPKAKEEHPEFFIGAAFARLLSRWSKQPPEKAEFFRIEERSRGAKKLLFILRNVNHNREIS
jgi:hypothetical protein